MQHLKIPSSLDFQTRLGKKRTFGEVRALSKNTLKQHPFIITITDKLLLRTVSFQLISTLTQKISAKVLAAGSFATGKSEMFTIAGATFAEIAPFPKRVSGKSVIYHAGYFYVFGGTYGNVLYTEIYSTPER